jgi:hypothetical protein
MVQETQTLQVHIADPLGQGAALLVKALRIGPLLTVRADHSKIVIGDSAALVVAHGLRSLE